LLLRLVLNFKQIESIIENGQLDDLTLALPEQQFFLGKKTINHIFDVGEASKKIH
jgi:hypothetical protein